MRYSGLGVRSLGLVGDFLECMDVVLLLYNLVVDTQSKDSDLLYTYIYLLWCVPRKKPYFMFAVWIWNNCRFVKQKSRHWNENVHLFSPISYGYKKDWVPSRCVNLYQGSRRELGRCLNTSAGIERWGKGWPRPWPFLVGVSPAPLTNIFPKVPSVPSGMVVLCTLPETNSEFIPENGWLEYLVSFKSYHNYRTFSGQAIWAYFQGFLLLVSGRVICQPL